MGPGEQGLTSFSFFDVISCIGLGQPLYSLDLASSSSSSSTQEKRDRRGERMARLLHALEFAKADLSKHTRFPLMVTAAPSLATQFSKVIRFCFNIFNLSPF